MKKKPSYSIQKSPGIWIGLFIGFLTGVPKLLMSNEKIYTFLGIPFVCENLYSSCTSLLSDFWFNIIILMGVGYLINSVWKFIKYKWY